MRASFYRHRLGASNPEPVSGPREPSPLSRLRDAEEDHLEEGSLNRRSRKAGPPGDLVGMSRADLDDVQDPLLVHAEISEVLGIVTFPSGLERELGGPWGR
jgi:hypothetical protein